MKRRELIKQVGATAVALPLVTYSTSSAQKVWRIGYLSTIGPSDLSDAWPSGQDPQISSAADGRDAMHILCTPPRRNGSHLSAAIDQVVVSETRPVRFRTDISSPAREPVRIAIRCGRWRFVTIARNCCRAGRGEICRYQPHWWRLRSTFSLPLLPNRVCAGTLLHALRRSFRSWRERDALEEGQALERRLFQTSARRRLLRSRANDSGSRCIRATRQPFRRAGFAKHSNAVRDQSERRGVARLGPRPRLGEGAIAAGTRHTF
jgi:hypothetical protein